MNRARPVRSRLLAPVVAGALALGTVSVGIVATASPAAAITCEEAVAAINAAVSDFNAKQDVWATAAGAEVVAAQVLVDVTADHDAAVAARAAAEKEVARDELKLTGALAARTSATTALVEAEKRLARAEHSTGPGRAAQVATAQKALAEARAVAKKVTLRVRAAVVSLKESKRDLAAAIDAVESAKDAMDEWTATHAEAVIVLDAAVQALAAAQAAMDDAFAAAQGCS